MEKVQDTRGSDFRAQDTRERILVAAEDLLRQYGPAKTTVVDVARRLGMSHANVYRHFSSKAALQDAVAERWLKTVSDPLAAIAAAEGSATERLERWMLTLVDAKRRKVLADPALFETYYSVAEAAREVVEAHVTALRGQLARIIRDGVAAGEFQVHDPETAAALVFGATMRYHHPRHVRETADRPAAEIAKLVAMLAAGLRAGVV